MSEQPIRCAIRVGDLSRRAIGTIRQNVAIAVVLKAVFLVITVAGVTGRGRPSWPTLGQRCWSRPTPCTCSRGRNEGVVPE